MVLIRRIALVAGLALVAGCGESLFDARGPRGDGGTGDGGDDPLGSCKAPCVADAAADFNGTPTGSNGHWRYLDDTANRQWTVMTFDGTHMVGNASRNRITTCEGNRDKPACQALRRALLVTSAGAAGGAEVPGGADPAIEFKAPSAQVIELRVRVFVPSGDDSQQIRLYRNSREDVLFTAIAAPGVTFDQTVTLDALAGDRFLVAIAASGPTATGATDLGLHLTISATNMPFPSSCQLALAFEVQTGSNVIDLCSAAVLSLRRVPQGTLAPLTRTNGPFFEQGSAARITDGTHFDELAGTSLDHAGGLTLQFWIQQSRAIPIEGVWAFSDLDPDVFTGIGIALFPSGPVPPAIEVTGHSNGALVRASAPFPDVLRWQFVRVVHSTTGIAVCVNGVRVASADGPSALGETFNTPVLGSEQFASIARFDGQLDDVRAISGTLPCE